MIDNNKQLHVEADLVEAGTLQLTDAEIQEKVSTDHSGGDTNALHCKLTLFPRWLEQYYKALGFRIRS